MIKKLQIRLLRCLARMHGVETSYRDTGGERRYASTQSLLAVLRALGSPVAGLSDVPDALRDECRRRWREPCEPAAVSWEGKPVSLALRLPAEQVHKPVNCRLELEDGRKSRWTCCPAGLPLLVAGRVEGVHYEARQLNIAGLARGYHRLTLDLYSGPSKMLLLSAPFRAYIPPGGANSRMWGVFLPLYSLHSGRSWGAGDLYDLEALQHWVNGLGGRLAGTLPLLAAFLDEPFAPSPYEPVSRLFWNEFYLAVDQVPELKESPGARELIESPDFQQEIKKLRDAPLVDYRRIMTVKRRVLEHCAKTCFAGISGRQDELRRWAAGNSAVHDYARFRAALEKQRAVWTEWPERMRNGILREGDYDPEAERYHLYVQWAAREQFRDLSARARQRGQGLYLDFPLGVHGAGYDVWRERPAFALEVSTGAPPDSFFTGGQDWGFPPLHPERIREQGYRYYIACVRHHLRYAAALRIDHVMGLHRLYWIPKGLPAGEGVYVRYRAEEFYAILSLESHRHRAVIVGEDLGTVPGCVRADMARHKLQRMYVLPFEIPGKRQGALNPVPANALACLNTHDMPPFAAFWLKGKKSAGRARLPIYLYKRGWLKVPTMNVKEVLRACLFHLAGSPARFLMVNLEDLWLETSAQNVPGTTSEHPNWQRKVRYPLEVFGQNPDLKKTLRHLDSLRKNTGQAAPTGGTEP